MCLNPFACSPTCFKRCVGRSCTPDTLLLIVCLETCSALVPMGLLPRGTRSRVDAHAHGEPCLISVVSSTGCLKHQGDLSLGSWCPAPTPKERPATAAPYRPQGVWKRQAPGRREASQGVVPSMVFPSQGYRGATFPLVHPSLGDLVSLHSLS